MTGQLNETEARIWLDLKEHNTIDELAELSSSRKSWKQIREDAKAKADSQICDVAERWYIEQIEQALTPTTGE